MSKLLTPENILNLLLVFVPVAIVLEVMHASPTLIFVASCLAIIPLAGVMGKATEHLAEKVGEGIGGLLNATFGNAAELIIAIVALRAGLYDVVKASITGSIIGNILLVFGLSALLGGVKYSTQSFNKTAASLGTTMLTLSVIGLVIPALFHVVVEGNPNAGEQELSLEIAIILMLTYILSLVFTLKTHSHLYVGELHDGHRHEGGERQVHHEIADGHDAGANGGAADEHHGDERRREDEGARRANRGHAGQGLGDVPEQAMRALRKHDLFALLGGVRLDDADASERFGEAAGDLSVDLAALAKEWTETLERSGEPAAKDAEDEDGHRSQAPIEIEEDAEREHGRDNRARQLHDARADQVSDAFGVRHDA